MQRLGRGREMSAPRLGSTISAAATARPHRARSQRRGRRRRSAVRARPQRRRQEHVDEAAVRLSCRAARAAFSSTARAITASSRRAPARARHQLLPAGAAGVRRPVGARQPDADACRPQAGAVPPLFRSLPDPRAPARSACRYALGRREEDPLVRARPRRGSAGDPARRAERRRAVGEHPPHGRADRRGKAEAPPSSSSSRTSPSPSASPTAISSWIRAASRSPAARRDRAQRCSRICRCSGRAGAQSSGGRSFFRTSGSTGFCR